MERNSSTTTLFLYLLLTTITFSSSSLFFLVKADDPYRFFTWNVTYGDIYPLGVKQQVEIAADVESDSLYRFWLKLMIWFDRFFRKNGIQQRRNSWQDGVFGTNCPIPPGKNFTYILQVKDQIGSYFYFPSLAFHKAAGGFGGIRVLSRPMIPVPFPPPAGDYTILAGDWFKANHTDLQAILDNGSDLPFPDGLLINGRGWNGNTFTVEQGKTYRFRISNVGISTSLNVRFQGHSMTLVEVEGSHTVQNTYSSLDVHLGQSYSVLLTADQPAQDYYIVVSTRFTSPVLTTTAVLHYSNSAGAPAGPPPGGPTVEVDWSLDQARSLRCNLTASGPRPNPQGSYHYGLINTTRTMRLANSPATINGKQRYAVNSVSFVLADTPLKVADFYNIPGVFSLGSIPDNPTNGGAYLQTSVMAANFRDYIEIIFENGENTVQSWHIDGYSFFVVGMDGGQWTPTSRQNYNLRDTVARCTVQVYPQSWTAIYMALDNVGMWNIRSESWARQYLGQQFYLRVYSPANSWRDEYPIPRNALLCGRASGRRTRPL
ncbi:L-ascorbate oxidase [Ananas comosus]|uniref:L-ascorbate oxidase n=1 Tax=Ananas comosus TaxID=4615 RepID=A0A199V2D7_ANACO|nr:L-ascorbate oxidase [Ananas comosus]